MSASVEPGATGREAVGWLVAAMEDVPADDAWLAPEERARVAEFRVPWRRADWRLGRWTAKRLLRAHLPQVTSLTDVVVRSAPDGAPEAWIAGAPAPVALAISHRAGLACCAVARAGVRVGCDAELVEPRSAAFIEAWLTLAERARVASAAAHDRALVANLLWSAKESALKALRQGLRLDPRDAEVTVARDLARRDGAWQPLVVRVGGRAFRGWWRREGGHVLTLVAEPAPARPDV